LETIFDYWKVWRAGPKLGAEFCHARSYAHCALVYCHKGNIDKLIFF